MSSVTLFGDYPCRFVRRRLVRLACHVYSGCMKTGIFAFTVVALSAISAGCVASGDLYPSLATRDVERNGDMNASDPRLSAAPLPSEIGREIVRLRDSAIIAHRRFVAAVPAARRSVGRATGASIASDAWSGGQIAIADLESLRSETAVPLSQLDVLYVAATIEFQERRAIAQMREEVKAILGEEDRILAELANALR